MRAPADGYTLMPGNMSQFAINPGLYSKLPYETLRIAVNVMRAQVSGL